MTGTEDCVPPKPTSSYHRQIDKIYQHKEVAYDHK